LRTERQRLGMPISVLAATDLPPVLGPVDLTPWFWPGSHKLQRGGVLGFIFGWRQHIQG
jgi:hypothetical protein